MSIAVRFEEVSKEYRASRARYASVRTELSALLRWLVRRRRPSGGPLERRRALDRLSFEVQAGEAFAIIGPNGAGKTTALKLMARISLPSAGRIRLCGRVGALIEVGAGIHPELTGRENIWLYGRFVGMTRAALAQRFDEIVDFCELAYVLDEPVKTYSTGMQLRLGFAVASHVDPDVLVVDEALAVGDAAFQAKCSERMAHLLRLGRTLVLVSHNLSAVEALCARGLLLIEGRARSLGPVHQVVRDYIDWVDAQHHSAARPAGALLRGGGLVLTRLTAHALDGDERYVFRPGEGIEVRLTVQAETAIRSPWFSLGVSDGRPGALIMCSMLERAEAFDLAPGEHQLLCRLPALPLAPRAYELWLSVRDASGAVDILDWSCVGSIRIVDPSPPSGPGALSAPWMYGPVRVPFEWSKG